MSSQNNQQWINSFQKMGEAVSQKLYITGLNDTPTGYLGHSGDYLVVNDGESGIHFTGIEKIAADLVDYGFGGGDSTIPSYTDLPDVTENDGKIVASGCDLYHSCNGTWNKIGGESIPAPDEAPGCVTNLAEYNQYQEYKDAFLANQLGSTAESILNDGIKISDLIFDVCLFPESSLEEEKNTVIIDETTYKWGMFASPQTINISAQEYSDGQGNDCVFNEWTSSNATFGDPSSANTTVFVDTDLSITGSFECLMASSQPSCDQVALHLQIDQDLSVYKKSISSEDLNINSNLGNGDISIDGNTMAIGAPYHNEGAGGYGAVFLFEKQESGPWLQTDIILPSRAQSDQGFGYGVELNGNELYIGVPFSSVNVNVAGNVILYKKQTDGSWLEFESIKQAFPTYGDHFGSSISIAGNTMAVGAYADDEGSDNGSNEGAVYIFERQTDGSWLQTHKILESSTNTTLFGFRVCLDGENLLAVSSYYANNTKGSVWLLEKQTDGSWSITDEVFPPNLINNGNYGNGLFFKGDQLFVGQNKNSEAGPTNGVVYLFTKQSDGSWLETSKIFDNTATADGERFGSSIELDGDILYVGSPLSDDGKGVVKIIDLSGGSVVLPELTDLSSNKHALTNTGVDIFGHADLFNVSAMNFDGNGDVLSIGDTSTFKFLHDGTTDYTLECWVRSEVQPGSITWYLNTYNTNGQAGIRLEHYDTNGYVYAISTADFNFHAIIHTTAMYEVNEWVHIAVTFQVGIGLKMYINGTQATTFLSNLDGTIQRPANNNPQGVELTVANSAAPQDFKGQIQDIRISKHVVYTSNFTPPTNLLDNPC